MGMRVPRMTGLPIITFGFISTRGVAMVCLHFCECEYGRKPSNAQSGVLEALASFSSKAGLDTRNKT